MPLHSPALAAYFSTQHDSSQRYRVILHDIAREAAEAVKRYDAEYPSSLHGFSNPGNPISNQDAEQDTTTNRTPLKEEDEEKIEKEDAEFKALQTLVLYREVLRIACADIVDGEIMEEEESMGLVEEAVGVMLDVDYRCWEHEEKAGEKEW